MPACVSRASRPGAAKSKEKEAGKGARSGDGGTVRQAGDARGGVHDRNDRQAGALPQKGFLKQEEIPLSPYLETRTGHYYTIGHKSRHG